MRGNSIESEKDIERKLGIAIKNRGGYSLKFVPLFVKGLPDRICLLPGGRIFFAELKTTNQKPTKLQLFWHARLRKLGFKVYIIDKSEQILTILKDYD